MKGLLVSVNEVLCLSLFPKEAVVSTSNVRVGNLGRSILNNGRAACANPNKMAVQ